MATVPHPQARGKPSNGRRRSRAPRPIQPQPPLASQPTLIGVYQQTLLMASQMVGFLGQLQRIQAHLLSVVEHELPLAPPAQEAVHQTVETVRALEVAVTTSRNQMAAELADLVVVLRAETP
jgi:hypothetical protein